MASRNGSFTDGINWEKSPSPILSGNISSEDARINASFILKKDNQYYLYYTYSAISNSTYKIGLAISDDGIHFTKYQNNPILKSTETWESLGIGWPSILKDNGNYKMVYSNASNSFPTGFGTAVSNDGINWTKENNNPFFTVYNSTMQVDQILFPYAIKVNNEERIYYTGFNSDNYPGNFNIGFASKK